jgi:hypothetical protein
MAFSVCLFWHADLGCLGYLSDLMLHYVCDGFVIGLYWGDWSLVGKLIPLAALFDCRFIFYLFSLGQFWKESLCQAL